MCVQLDRGLSGLGERGLGVVEAAAQTAGGLFSITTDIFIFSLCFTKMGGGLMLDSFISVILSLSFCAHVTSAEPKILVQYFCQDQTGLRTAQYERQQKKKKKSEVTPIACFPLFFALWLVSLISDSSAY